MAQVVETTHAAGELTGTMPADAKSPCRRVAWTAWFPGPAKSRLIGFTDDRLTGTGGAEFLAEAAKRLGLLPLLAEAVSVKRREGGCPAPDGIAGAGGGRARGVGARLRAGVGGRHGDRG